MSENLQKNKNLVKNVFDAVYDKYDLMNDLMSLGAHRYWKNNFIKMMNPYPGQSLIDVGCGTGDIAKLFSEATNGQSKILSVDPNDNMIEKGKNRLSSLKNITWQINRAENLKVKTESFDFYTISFGLRNTSNIQKALSEAYRVLKRGGRFMCLEFSKIENSNLNYLYNEYSKLIPIMGKYVIGDSKPYDYLVKTIDKFLNQEELIDMLRETNFTNCEYTNINAGIVSVHSGWKI